MPIIPKRDVTKEELQQLEEFLTAEHIDAKPLNLTQTHGFLSAIASAPSLIMPSKYQEVLLGGHPEFASLRQAQAIMMIIILFHNGIISSFSDKKWFFPLLWEKGEIVG
jgi:yecA family protein